MPSSQDFYQGIAVVVGTVARNGYPSIAVDAMDGNGVTLHDLICAKADEFDLKPIRDEYKLQGRDTLGHNTIARRGNDA